MCKAGTGHKSPLALFSCFRKVRDKAYSALQKDFPVTIYELNSHSRENKSLPLTENNLNSKNPNP